MRRPGGFHAVDVPAGILLTRQRTGRWVVLAGDPHVKIDNCHRDGRAHLHIGGWHGAARKPLRPDLAMAEVVAAIQRHLEAQGFIDLDRLGQELS